MPTHEQKLISCAWRVALKGTAATATDVADLDGYVHCGLGIGATVSDNALLHVADRYVERGPTEATVAALKAAVLMAIEERTEAAEPGTEQSQPQWYTEGQYA